MNTIYEPKGKAKEYSPLALNVYNGCDHDCQYCYTKLFQQNTTKAMPRNNLVEELKKVAPKYSDTEQVLLCFMGDPYCKADVEYQVTRKVLEVLLENNVLTAILTKGGSRALRDIDIIKRFGDSIKFGSTLTFVDDELREKYEPGASTAIDRIETLKEFHSQGVKTWVSLEPVIYSEQTIKVIEKTYPFVDEYKIGLTNYFQLPKPIDWKTFTEDVVALLRKLDKKFYVKEDLRKYCQEGFLTNEECDMSALYLKKTGKVNRGMNNRLFNLKALKE